MRLQLGFELACEINHVGCLALVGTAPDRSAKDESGVATIVTFLLAFKSGAPLARYFNPQGGFNPSSMLHEIFVGEGIKPVTPVGGDEYGVLIFNREVEGELRNPLQFLHATAEKILCELQELEENELSMLEVDDEVSWANENYGCEGEMPDFRRPRHE